MVKPHPRPPTPWSVKSWHIGVALGWAQTVPGCLMHLSSHREAPEQMTRGEGDGRDPRHGEAAHGPRWARASGPRPRRQARPGERAETRQRGLPSPYLSCRHQTGVPSLLSVCPPGNSLPDSFCTDNSTLGSRESGGRIPTSKSCPSCHAGLGWSAGPSLGGCSPGASLLPNLAPHS